jgi:hypothetical protein
MATAKLHVGSVGVEVQIPLTDPKGNPIDLSTATFITIYFVKPTAAKMNKPISKYGSGQTGVAIWLTAAGDVDVAGDWQVQVRVQYNNPIRDWWSQIYPMSVASTLA